MLRTAFRRTLATLAAAAVSAMVLPTAASAAGLLEQINSEGRIQVGLEGTYPPFNYQDESGELVGFEVDFARALAGELGVEAEFVPTKWDGMLAGLDTKRFDVIVNQVTITPERRKKYDFSEPYTISGMQIIVRQGMQDEIDGPADLAGRAVGVGLGTNYEQWLNENVPEAQVETYQDDPSKLQDLRVGRIDAVINDKLMVGFLMEKSDGRIVAAGEPFATQRVGVALRKGNDDLLAAVNEAIADLRESGELAEISEKWFGIDVTQ
ncbi:cystine ABC transporter substrate-binding protein [Arhodomonas sp. AD133]|uniref:cystine ABC transporter substrate-binding protein n=1 Tax=Arhodomonas sp. AD133 TaxID=3415009 RepID=UPI003EBFFCF0